jgi:hypothetical protein
MSSIGKAIGGVVGGITGTSQAANATQDAATTQANASNYAAQLASQAQGQLRTDLSPYSSLGTAAIPQILKMLGYSGSTDSSGNVTGLTQSGSTALNTPFSFSASDLDSTPGYQFTLAQGNRAVNNQAAASGLNLSGAQLKGISDYTTGLADSTYNSQYQNALSTYNTNYGVAQNQLSSLLGLLQTGQNSAAQVGTSGINTANTIGSNTTSAANATAAGQIAAGNTTSNALTSGLGALSSGIGAYGLYTLLSDMRFKTEIKPLGKTPGGHNWYEFEYLLQPGVKHQGVMAQEIEQVIPSAVVEINGIKHVDYAKVH